MSSPEGQHALGLLVKDAADEVSAESVGVQIGEILARIQLSRALADPEAYTLRAIGHEALAVMHDRHHYTYKPRQVIEGVQVNNAIVAFYQQATQEGGY